MAICIMEKRSKKFKMQYQPVIATQWPDETISGSGVFSELPRSNCIDTREKTRKTSDQVDIPCAPKGSGSLKRRASSVTSCSSLLSYSSGASESCAYFSPTHSSTEENLAMFSTNQNFSTPQAITFADPQIMEDTFEDSEDKRTAENSKSMTMTNMDFFKTVEPLQNKLNQASTRLQLLLGKYTECDFEQSSLFKPLKSSLVPYIEDFSTALGIIPRVLSSTFVANNRSCVEIGVSTKYQICQDSFERAVSKYSIKDAAVALAECDKFLTKTEKLESTIGRASNSSSTGKKLKPLDPQKLDAFYHIIADNSKMPNIQRTEDCRVTSPDCLTVKEQKMVREALSQYFNQLRQRQKRKRSTPDNTCNITD